MIFAYLALPCLFKNVDCGDKGQCENQFNDYSCSCGDGAMKKNETDPQSTCIIDYCYQVDCNRGQCKVSSNDYICECESGLWSEIPFCLIRIVKILEPLQRI